MANTFDPLKAEIWASEIQENLYPMLTSLEVVKKVELVGADTMNKPYVTKPIVKTYTAGSDLSIPDMTATNEQLALTTVEAVPVYIDKVDEIESDYSIRATYGDEIANSLASRLDAVVFSEYDNFTSDVDDGDIGGTAGDAISINASNVRNALAAAGRKLDNLNVPQMNRVAVLSPSVCEVLAISVAGQDMPAISPMAFERGYVGRFFGFEVFKSANLTFTARWTPANNPSNAATISIAGVTFTFVSSIGSTAGNVLIGGSTAATLDNLVAFLGDLGTTSATQVALSVADQAKLTGIVATDGTTYLGIEHVGGGEVAVTTSESADPWSLQTVHNILGQRGRIHMAMAPVPKIGFNQEPKRMPGSGNLIGSIDYGLKTFTRDADYLVDLNIDGSDF